MTKSRAQQIPIVLFLLVTWIGYPAIANAQSASSNDIASRADLDKDGAIDRSELIQLREGIFERMDRNDDEIISITDRPQRAGGARFDDALENLQTQFDVDGDRQISRNELIGAASPTFGAGDIDGDGTLSADEIATLRRARDR